MGWGERGVLARMWASTSRRPATGKSPYQRGQDDADVECAKVLVVCPACDRFVAGRVLRPHRCGGRGTPHSRVHVDVGSVGAAPTSVHVAPPTTRRPVRPVGGIRRRGEGRGCSRRRRPRTVRTLGVGRSVARTGGEALGPWRRGPPSLVAGVPSGVGGRFERTVPASAAGDGGILGSHRRPRRRAGGRDESGLRTH